jgi:hypothetical protein
MLGNIKVLFGTVVNVMDEQLIYRVQVQIPGYTDNVIIDDLPWYFPWYGVNFLPEVKQVVPVILFDNNFSTAFYCRVVGNVGDDKGLLKPCEFTEDDYQHYLEIFKRTVNDKSVYLRYTPTDGIIFENGMVKQQLLIGDKNEWNMWVGENQQTHLQLTEDRIFLGSGDAEKHPVLLGDVTRDELTDFEKYIKETLIKEVYTVFDQIGSTAMGSPYTIPIGTLLQSLSPASKLNCENNLASQLTANAKYQDKIKSESVFVQEKIEK